MKQGQRAYDALVPWAGVTVVREHPFLLLGKKSIHSTGQHWAKSDPVVYAVVPSRAQNAWNHMRFRDFSCDVLNPINNMG